jgi:site-specific DNA recombinase
MFKFANLNPPFSANVFKAYHSILERMFENEDVERKRNLAKTISEIEKKNEQKNNIQELLRDGKLTIEEYRELKNPIDSDIFRLEKIQSELNEQFSPYKEYINNHVPMLENLLGFYQNSSGKVKNKILSCIFSEKIHFDENRVAAISFQKPIEVLLNASKVLQRGKKEKEVKIDLLPTLALPSGLEPETL